MQCGAVTSQPMCFHSVQHIWTEARVLSITLRQLITNWYVRFTLPKQSFVFILYSVVCWLSLCCVIESVKKTKLFADAETLLFLGRWGMGVVVNMLANRTLTLLRNVKSCPFSFVLVSHIRDIFN